MIVVILDTIYEFVEKNDCDVIFVTNDEVMYATIQKIRMEKNIYFEELPIHLKRKGFEIARYAKSGNLSIFIGAGVSMG